MYTEGLKGWVSLYSGLTCIIQIVGMSEFCNKLKCLWMHCTASSHFFSTCRVAWIPKRLHLNKVLVTLYFMVSIMWVLTYSHNQFWFVLSLLWWKWLALLKCNHFPRIHINVHQYVSLCWGLHGKYNLWNSEVWKCYAYLLKAARMVCISH